MNRQSLNSTLTPSVWSTDSASGPYFASTVAMVAGTSGTRRLISPLAGNAFTRSPTSCDRVRPVSHMICVTSSQGIMPLSQ